MYNFGRCLGYGKEVDQDFFRVTKYYRLSAEQNNAAAQNMSLAASYYLRSAQQGHPDSANNFGFCLEHGRSVE
jgi:TPR repeat protein